jgi:hypothetical protein
MAQSNHVVVVFFYFVQSGFYLLFNIIGSSPDSFKKRNGQCSLILNPKSFFLTLIKFIEKKNHQHLGHKNSSIKFSAKI